MRERFISLSGILHCDNSNQSPAASNSARFPLAPSLRREDVNFSGFLAWFLWRGIYWSKLPRIEKKVRVAIDWALDVFFSKDFVQYLDQRALAHTQTETGTALWNREQLSVAGIDDPGCSGVDHAHQPGSPPPATVAA